MIDHQPIPEAHQKRLKALMAVKKISGAARLLGRDRQTIKSAAAGIPVHPFIAGELAKAIAERDKEGKNP